jgi:hypothetical protein
MVILLTVFMEVSNYYRNHGCGSAVRSKQSLHLDMPKFVSLTSQQAERFVRLRVSTFRITTLIMTMSSNITVPHGNETVRVAKDGLDALPIVQCQSRRRRLTSLAGESARRGTNRVRYRPRNASWSMESASHYQPRLTMPALTG